MPFNHTEEHTDDNMMIIQVNIDDMNPELCTYVSDILLEKGANDVYWIPLIMKKGRPGLMLNVLVDRALQDEMTRAIFQETTTMGMRYLPVTCHRLGRKWVNVATAWGDVPVKLGYYEGKMVQYAPEFKQCDAIARTHHVPLKEVYDRVRLAFQEQYREDLE